MEGNAMTILTRPDSDRDVLRKPKWLLASVLFAVLTALLPARGWIGGAAQSTSDARSTRFAVAEANGSGLEARVKLIDLDGQTRVVVAIRGVKDGEFLPHIHSGSCAAYDGTPDFPLALFPADERSRTTVDISYDELVTGDYLVDIHPVLTSVDELFNPATAVVCGPIGGVRSEPEPTPEQEIEATAWPDTGIGPIPDRYWSTMLISMLALMAVVFAGIGFDLRRRAMLTIAQRRLIRLTGRQL
jgi:hypothetical protein